ncbi:MAG TPA: hypothetical protein VMX16_07650 [Terriglobia bacterium]|nr:hypothetical protein [Terriglobia bacterium]
MSGNWPSIQFPNLNDDNHEIQSVPTQEYNCIAWAAGDTRRWWWPDDPKVGYGYWPPGVKREVSLDAFVEAYQTLGYEPCLSPTLELDFEKVALYVDSGGIPTHAALQLANGNWTSKLGGFEDIEHKTLECLNSQLYGESVSYLRRRRRIRPLA